MIQTQMTVHNQFRSVTIPLYLILRRLVDCRISISLCVIAYIRFAFKLATSQLTKLTNLQTR